VAYGVHKDANGTVGPLSNATRAFHRHVQVILLSNKSEAELSMTLACTSEEWHHLAFNKNLEPETI